jgi:CRP-like cAMP-binding protein
MYEKIEKQYGELFVNISEELETQVRKLCIPEEYQTDDVIFEEGSEAENLYILVSGEIELKYSLPLKHETMEVSITKLKSGQAFGWSALSQNRHYSLKAIATTKSKTLCISGTQLMTLMEEYPELGYPVMKYVLNIVDARLQDTRNELRWLLSSCS